MLLIDSTGTVIAGDPSHRRPGSASASSDIAFCEQLGERDEGTIRGEGLDGVRRIFGFVRVPSSDARLLVGLNEAEVLAAHRPRDHARLSAARLLRPAGAVDRLVRRRAPDRRSDPVAGAHRRALRPRRSAGARFARGLGQGVRAAHRRAQRHGAEARRARAASCAPPTATCRSSRRATRCPASPTGAASTRGSPPNGSAPASSVARSRC